MMHPVPTTKAQHMHDKRQLYRMAVTNAQTRVLKKVFDDSTPGFPDRFAAVQLNSPIVITGEALAKSTQSKSQIFVRNVTLQDADTGAILLQRFGPSSLDKADDMRSSFQRGKALFQLVSEKARCKKLKVDTWQTKEQQAFPHFHFGAWYDLFFGNLVTTSEFRQAGNEDGKGPVTDFCAWFKQFAIDFIQPIINNNASGLCDVFRAELTERQNVHFPWAAKQVEGLDSICHSLYSTFSPFQGFSSVSHIDNDDADVSILVNLGQHAILELRHYNCHVVLQPFDVIFFLSNSIFHRTLQHKAHKISNSSPSDRMAITCFFRQALLDHRIPRKANVIHLAKLAFKQ